MKAATSARRRSAPNAARHCMGLRRWPIRHRSCCASARSGSARNCGRRCRCGPARRSTGRWTYAPSRAFPRDRVLDGRARFVTPDADVTVAQASAPAPAAGGQIFHGTGTVIAALTRVNRLVLSHPEIKGFMPAMEMSYPVNPPKLLEGLKSGDQVEFTIDA